MSGTVSLTSISDAEYLAVLRSDFYTFLHRCFVELNAALPFLPNWHIEVLAATLQGLGKGETCRLVINIPPRHLKSLAASIALPAWLLGHDPTLSIINVTYGQELSDKFARDFRTIMTSLWYKAAFPTRLVNARGALQELLTTRGGSRFATSVGGVMTGHGADLILIDDPLKPTDAMSEARRVGVNEWFDGTLYSRLNDKAKGVIAIIMQRLHEDDPVGHVMQREPWTILSFAAIAEADENYRIDTLFGTRTFHRKIGEALHPARESIETLADIRRTIGEYNFAGQYQQTPAPTGGGMVKEAWFKRFKPGGEPSSFDRIIQSWDTANKPTELADYSVCTTWGFKGPRFYLLNVVRKKMGYPELRRAVLEQHAAHRPHAILIEDKASGTQLIQDLIEGGISAVTRFEPDGDKIMRLHAQSSSIENGFVHLPTEAPWLADYLHEFTTFPSGRHDDQVDSTTQMLAWARLRPPGYGMFEYYRQESQARQRAPVTALIRLEAPPGISHFTVMSGRTYQVIDGAIEVEESDVADLVRRGMKRLAQGCGT